MRRGVESLPRRLAAALVAVVAILGYGTGGYMILGFGVVDALYMATLALTTAGFTPAGELDGVAKGFTITIAIFGVAVFLVLLSIVVSVVTEGRLGTVARRRRMERRIEGMRDHYIICAYGRVGRTVAREFEAEGVAFAVIDAKDDLEPQMQADGVLYLIGDPTQEDLLLRAGVERARGLVSCVDSDADNVFITLSARSLNPDIYIVARASETRTPDRLYRAGANRVISPYVASGRHMALLTLRPRVVDYLEVAAQGERTLRLEELLVEPDSPLVGKTVSAACGEATPLLLQRSTGETVANPGPEEIITEDDLIILLGEPGVLRPVEGA